MNERPTLTHSRPTPPQPQPPGRVVRTLAICATLGLSLALSACGGGGDSSPAPAPAPIPAPPVVAAAADNLTVALGQVGLLLANDTLGGAAVTAGPGGNVSFELTSGLPPLGIGVNNGTVNVAPTAAAGTVSLSYRICQSGSTTNCANAAASIVVPAQGSLSGRAVDAASAAGIAGVRVRLGAQSTTTGADGAFSLSAVPAGTRLTVVFDSDTHAESARIADVTHATDTDVQARLVRTGVSAALNIALGGTVVMPGNPAQVTLPAAGLQRADGTVPGGNVTVRMTPIDPASDSSVMPGDFSTSVGGATTPIESYGALNVVLRDDGGAPLNLRPGQSATLRIPLASRDTSPPATIPLFFFNNTTGLWVQEGTAALTGTAPNRYYQGTVTHFSTWNADLVMDTVRVTGCVADVNGQRIANARVNSDGVDYSGTSSGTTNATGDFTIPMRRSSQATLVGRVGGQSSNTLRVGPFGGDSTLPSCLVLGAVGGGVTMTLSWGERPGDLDSHLLTPAGDHVFFGNDGSLGAAPFASLDVDDTNSFGPEVITVSRLMVGTYTYYVRNYSGFGNGPISASGARVSLSISGRATELFTPPAGGENSGTNVWVLFELDVNAQCNVTVRRVPAFVASDPTPAAAANPVYCVR